MSERLAGQEDSPQAGQAAGARAGLGGFTLRRILMSQEIGIILVLLVIAAFLSVQTKTFLKADTIFNILMNFSWIAISAFGECMVIITAGIDLSPGSVMALTGLITAMMLVVPPDFPILGAMPEGLRVIVSIAGGLLLGTALGFINGILISGLEDATTKQLRITQGVVGGLTLVIVGLAASWPIGLAAAVGIVIVIQMMSIAKLPPFIATLGMMSGARGACYGISRGWPVPSKAGTGGATSLPDGFRSIASYLHVGPLSIPWPGIIMLTLAVLVSLFLTRTVWGYRIYALGGNEQATRLSGINVNRIRLLVYTLAGLLTGLGGLLMTAKLGVAAPTAALAYELDVIAAVVIGGTSLMGGEGTILGVLIGAAIMQTLRTGLTLLGFPAYWQQTASGTVIIVAVMFDQWRKQGRR
jgi:ribose transport system permease protein